MGSTFASVYVSYRAMSAATAASSTVGNNISNMNTEGYTRQRTQLESQTLSGYKSRFDQNLISTGNGVAATGTTQIRDIFLDARYRSQAADSGRFEAISACMTDIENVLDEISTKGMQKQFDDFVNQLQNLSQYPTSKDLGLVARTSAQQLAQMINVYSNQLTQVRAQEIYDLREVVVGTDFNATVESIADLNGQIREEYLYGNNPNELLDRRNTLIDNLSKIANIKVTTTPEEVSDGLILERLSISMYDENTSAYIGLVDHTKANTLEVHDNGDKVTISMNTTFRLENTPTSVDYDNISQFFTTGKISSYLDMINGHGDYANIVKGENDFRGIPYYQDVLNTFARNFAENYNSINSLQTTNKDAIAILSSNVAKAAGFDSGFMESYLGAVNKFHFENGSGEVTISDIVNGDPVTSIKVHAQDVSAMEFFKTYVESKALVKDTDYTVDSDGNYTLTNASAIGDLIPSTKLSGIDMVHAKEAFKAETEPDGTITKMTVARKNLFEPSDNSKEITAANIAISANWINNPLYITTTKDFNALDGKASLAGGNDNVLRMISSISKDNRFPVDPSNPDSANKFTGTYNEYLISMGGTLALDVEMNKNYQTTNATILASINNSRESTSGVSLDEEASNLLTFQSAYNAAARYFTAIDEMLDKLINGTGLVGR